VMSTDEIVAIGAAVCSTLFPPMSPICTPTRRRSGSGRDVWGRLKTRDVGSGVAWAGNPRPHILAAAAIGRRRSIAPDRLAPLFESPGLHFFSLQKEGAAAPADFPLIDFMAEMQDFADTAALIANLDLIISVDTSVVHLAAALGKPVWVLDRFDSCWHWLVGLELSRGRGRPRPTRLATG
jgi:hypothetical protein